MKNPDASRLQGPIIATSILASIAVALRFVARKWSKAGLAYDDFLIIPALLCALGLLFNDTIWLVNSGLGQHIELLTLQDMTNLQKGAYVVEVLWVVAVTLIKFSILLLYLRLFEKFKIARWTIRILLAIVISWGISIFFLTIFQCSPISRIWTIPIVPGTCITDGALLLIAGTVPHIITDVAILLTPIPAVWALQLQLSQRLILCGIFGLGSLVTIISGIRLHYIVAYSGSRRNDPDLTEDLVNVAIWTSVEVNIAIICGRPLPACLPCLRPIGSFVADKLEALRRRNKQSRRGQELLVDMLPRRKQKRATSSIIPVSPVSRDKELPDTSTIEIEARERLMPEMDESYLQEMSSDGAVAVELGAHSSVMELEARELRPQRPSKGQVRSQQSHVV